MRTLFSDFFKPATVLAVMVVCAVACAPEQLPDEDKPGDGSQEELVNPLADSLENVIYKQARAMQLMLVEEDVHIKSFKNTEQEGVCEISLTSGASFNVLLGDAVSGILSYVEEDSVKYWALIDKDGSVSAVSDSEGRKVPMTAEMDILVEGNRYFMKVGDKSYDLGYTLDEPVQVFTVNPFVDPSEVVYAAQFDFEPEKSKVVYLSGYAGVYFYLLDDDEKKPVSEMYVPAGSTVPLGLTAFEGLEHSVNVSSEQWTVVPAEIDGQKCVNVTAPEQVVEVNAPVTMSVTNGDGSWTYSSVVLTEKPFRSVFVSATEAVVIPSSGVKKFAYGVMPFSDFDADAVFASAKSWLAGEGTPSAGCAVSETQVSRTFADILGAPLDAESRYVLWAAVEGELVFKEFGEIVVDINVVKSYLLDADVEISVLGADALFYGIVEKTETAVDDILYQISGLDSLTVTHNFSYEGKASGFVSSDGIRNELRPQTEYLLWVVPAAMGEYTYTENDVFTKPLTTNPVVGGGSLEITCGEPKVTTSSMSFSLSCEGATMIYYAFLDKTGGNRYASDEVDNDTKFKQITNVYNQNRIGDCHTVISNKTEALCKGLNDVAATEYWLYAVAVDSEGRYGKVHCVSAKTLALEYDESITLSVEAYDVTSKKATFKVTSAGGDLSEYIYWVGRATDPFYANSTHCGGTKTTAQKYMALNPDDENISRCMLAHGALAADGTITIEGMTMETEYVFVILEKGEKNYSRIGYKKIKTLAADLGTIVREGTAEWNAAKNSVNIEWHKHMFESAASSGMTSTYGFRFSCPESLTAYVMAASDTYFSGAGIVKMEHIMIEIENYASRRYANGSTPILEGGILANEPDYYKDGELKPGQLMNVYTFHVHGLPSMGFVTYFAKGSHGEGNCIYWKNGYCEQYEAYKQSIERYNSLDAWLERADAFGLEGKEAEDWAEALLEAYSVYYKDAKPIVYENDGKGIDIYAPYAMGLNEDGEVTDRVVVMFKDLQGNYYEPMYFEVPNYFEQK